MGQSKFSLELLPSPSVRLQNAMMLDMPGLLWVTTSSDDADRKGTLVFKAHVEADDYDAVTSTVPKYISGPRKGKTGPPATVKFTCGCEARDVWSSGAHKDTTDVDVSHCEHGHKVERPNVPPADSPNVGDPEALRAAMVKTVQKTNGIGPVLAEQVVDALLK